MAKLVLPGPVSALHGVYRVLFSPDGKLLATRGADQIVRLWDLASGKQLHAIDGHQDRVLGLVFSPDGRVLFTSSPGVNEKVRSWDTATGKALQNLGRGGSLLCILPDRTTLLVIGPEQLGRFNLSTGQQLDSQIQHRIPLAVSRDGALLAALSGSRSGSVQIEVFETATGRRRYALGGLTDEPLAVEFSCDGSYLAASARRENVVHLWDLRHQATPATLSGHTGPIQALAFSHDGRHLATASWDRTLRVWEVDTAKPILALQGHTEHVCAVDFSADDRRLASGAAGQTDTSAIVWDVSRALFAAPPRSNKIEPAGLDRLWDRLAAEDPASAYPAIGSLRSMPQISVPFVANRIRVVVQPVGSRTILELIHKLDDDDFSVREAAQKRLIELRAAADSLLLKVATETDSAEVRHRIERILQTPIPKNTLGDAERRRLRRAILLLELIGNKPARGQIMAIATGHSDPDIAREAAAAAERLASAGK